VVLSTDDVDDVRRARCRLAFASEWREERRTDGDLWRKERAAQRRTGCRQSSGVWRDLRTDWVVSWPFPSPVCWRETLTTVACNGLQRRTPEGCSGVPRHLCEVT